MASPEAVAQHDYRRTPGAVLFWRESAAEASAFPSSGNIEAEIISGGKALWLAGTGQCERSDASGGHRRKGFGAIAEVLEILIGRAKHWKRRQALGDKADLIGSCEGQGTQQHSIDYAENRGIRANPEGQRENRDRGETGIVTEGS